MPFTTTAVLKGSAIMLASSVTDAPELLPFAYGLIYTIPATCEKKPDMCARMARAYAGAAKFIQEKPQETFEILKKRFPKLDEKLLEEAWKRTFLAHAKDVRVTVPQLENSQKVSIQAKLLEPKDELKSFDGLYTDKYLK
jgi:ABC-type nitrate/sulfonate/bicarbonate transport system substrate-binding protein